MRLAGWLIGVLTAIVMAGCMSKTNTVQSEQQTGLFETTVSRDVRLAYLLYLPKEYDTSGQKWPLVLFLHGAGERGSDLEKLKIHGPTKQAAAGKPFSFILVAPQCPQESWWTTKTEELALLVDHIAEIYRVDISRLYVTGLSMGGYGTWSLITQYPDKFAAAVPICGGGDDVLARFRLSKMPIWAFHGAKDPVVGVRKSEEMVNAMKQAGNTAVKLTVYPDAGHDSWTETYNNPEVYAWLLSHSKP